jgi:hypothetical protein
VDELILKSNRFLILEISFFAVVTTFDASCKAVLMRPIVDPKYLLQEVLIPVMV